MKTALALAISVVFSASLVTGQCPNSTWIHSRNKCYFLKSERADLYENIALCNQLNASLVSILSKEENDEVTRILYEYKFWLGLGQKVNVSSAFYWFDGKPFAYNNWKNRQSNLKYKYWAAIFSLGYWYSVLPFDQYNQVCSINLEPSSSYIRTPNPAEIKETLVDKQCPNSTWIRHGNKCYFVKEEEADLYENIDLCNQLNASMVSIASEAENIQVTRLISPDTPLWLGLGLDQKSNHSKEFHWFDGSPFVYSSWKYEPDVSDKYFGAYIVKGEWHNHYPYGFGRRSQMCSIDLNRTTPYKVTPNPADIKETLVSGQCPNSTWIRRANKCYFVKRERSDFYENIDLCNQLNASMVSITSEEENIHATRLILQISGSLWLGLGQRSNDSKEFYWFDGSPFVYNSWSKEPNETYKYFGAYLARGIWHIDIPVMQRPQVCSLDLTLKASPKPTPIPVEFREISDQCPNTTWRRVGSKCIFFDTKKALTYKQNQALCKKLNATMVSIHSEKENIQLSKLSRGHPFWLGIKIISPKDRLYEWEDVSPKTFENWGKTNLRDLRTKHWAAYSYNGMWLETLSDYKFFPACQTFLLTDGEDVSIETTN